MARWKNSKSEKKIRKSENDQKISPSKSEKNQKADLNAASRQTCFVQHIIYALISFGLLVDDKQKKQ